MPAYSRNEYVLVLHALFAAVRETHPDDGSGDALVGRFEGLHIPVCHSSRTNNTQAAS